ncbi:MAG: alpha-galactosidase [Bacteroidales bacterium]|nr:alpha-galactosidase [Bacteroidales bacterium]
MKNLRILTTVCLWLQLCLLCKAANVEELTRKYMVDFSYAGQRFSPESWTHHTTTDNKRGEHTVAYESPDGKLRLTLIYRQYADFPVTEVRPILECCGEEETDIIDGFKSLSLVRPCQSNGIRIRRITGSRTLLTDFCRQDVVLRKRHECDKLQFSTDEGRSAAWLPYFGVDFDHQSGMEIAIGWTGTWQADLRYADGFSLTAGIKSNTHFRMRPGERFAMPYTVIYERTGKSAERGLVEFHRFIVEHKAPRNAKGEIWKPLLPLTASGGNKTDENMLKILDKGTKYFKAGFDAFWVDANWYGKPRELDQSTNCGPDWYQWVGEWTVNTCTHPAGNMKRISDAAHQKGMRFLVWFEPERATSLSSIVKRHPEYFHRTKHNPSDQVYLLDMGNPEARQWITEEVSRNIRESGIDIYRQDFNCDPLPIWRDNDEADRQGVGEITHINGLYAFWDELQRRFPNMMFENCASGGTRMDIEMMSRAHSYCRDDAHMWPDCDEMTQNITLHSTPYLPFTGGETFTVKPFDSYAFLSRLGAGTVFTPSDFNGMLLRREPDEKECAWFNTMLGLADRVRPFFFGDFFALTHDTFDASDTYCGYQLNDNASGKGFYLLFRRKDCPDNTFYLQLRDIDAAATYTVEEFEGRTVRMKGSELARQLLDFPTSRSYKLVFYTKEQDRPGT